MKLYRCKYCGRIFRNSSIPHKCKYGFCEQDFYFEEMSVLDLVLKGEWYDMIESGEKKEEYREIKPYWVKRLIKSSSYGKNDNIFPKYEYVRFRRGYTNIKMLFKLECITKGVGNPDWGAPKGNVFVLKFGKILK